MKLTCFIHDSKTGRLLRTEELEPVHNADVCKFCGACICCAVAEECDDGEVVYGSHDFVRWEDAAP